MTELCQDEGCPHHGTDHVCINGRDVLEIYQDVSYHLDQLAQVVAKAHMAGVVLTVERQLNNPPVTGRGSTVMIARYERLPDGSYPDRHPTVVRGIIRDLPQVDLG